MDSDSEERFQEIVLGLSEKYALGNEIIYMLTSF